MLSQEEALRAYAAMMNTLDASKFIPLLADDFHYASQWVFAEITSKREYFDYITKKLEAVKDSGAKVWAEMGEAEESFAVLSHGEGKDGTVQRLDMCMPELYRWKRSGNYPQ
jgi:hypothetical protein